MTKNKVQATTGNKANLIVRLKNIESKGLSTIEDAFNAPQISKLERECPIELRMKLELSLASMMGFYGVTNDAMLHAIIEAIIEDWKTLTVSDILLALKWGRQGRWGKNYGNFSGKLVMEWISEYDQEKVGYCHTRHTTSANRMRDESQKSIPIKRMSDFDMDRITQIEEYKSEQP